MAGTMYPKYQSRKDGWDNVSTRLEQKTWLGQCIQNIRVENMVVTKYPKGQSRKDGCDKVSTWLEQKTWL